jgi:hypothetical protein
MSKQALPIIEWRPDGVRVYDPVTGKTSNAPNVRTAAINLSSKLVGLVIGRSHSFVKTIHLPDTSKSEALPAFQLQLGTHFPLGSDALAADFEFLDEKSSEGRLALAVAAKTELIKKALDDLKASGLSAAWTAPAALGGQALAESEGTANALVITEISDGISLDVIQSGSLVYSRSVKGEVTASLIESAIARTAAASGAKSAQVLAAGGLEIAGAEGRTKLDDLSALSLSDGPELLLVLPEQIAALDKKKTRSRGLIALVAFVVAAGTVDMVMQDYEFAGKEAAKATNINADARKYFKDQHRIINADLVKLENEAAVLSNAFEPAQQPGDVAQVAANLVPEGVWLTGLTIDRGRPLQIRGTARTSEAVSLYVQTLSASERLRDVKLLFANNAKIDETAIVRFSVTAHIVGSYPLVQKQTRRSRR